MANDIEAFNPQLWSARIQKRREKLLVSKPVSSFEEQANLTHGARVHRPTAPEFLTNDYNKYGNGVSIQEVKSEDQYLDVDQVKEVSFYIDAVEDKQSKYDAEAEAVKSAVYSISQEMDYTRFKETINAADYADAATAGGSAGTPYTPAVSTLTEFIENSKAKLRLSGAEQDREWYLVATPKMVSYIAQSFIKDGFNLADSGLRNGYKGDAYGLKVYESTNLLHEVKFTADKIAATNTFAIAGITFTFVSSIGSTAGNVLMGSTDADALTNAALAVNAGSGAGTNYIEISDANRAKLRKLGVYAVADTTAKTLTIYANGPFTFAGTATTFVPGALVAHCELGRKGAVDMVVQIDPKVQKNKVPNKTGYNFIIYDLYGVKTFDEGKYRMLDLRVAG